MAVLEQPHARLLTRSRPHCCQSARADALASITSAHFSHHVTNSLLTPLLPLIRDAFVLSYAETGLLISAYGISLGGSNSPMGMLADRFGSRPVIVVGLLLTG